MKITVIRHFPTEGNLKKRYIGSTDEDICKTIGFDYSYLDDASVVFVSPMKRAINTCDFLFPEAKKIIVNDLREMDFGIFENRNYIELKDSKEYSKWLDSNCENACPCGESRKAFCQRTVNSVKAIKKQALSMGLSEAVIVAHGGTAMALGEAFGEEGTSYFDTHIDFGESVSFEI